MTDWFELEGFEEELKKVRKKAEETIKKYLKEASMELLRQAYMKGYCDGFENGFVAGYRTIKGNPPEKWMIPRFKDIKNKFRFLKDDKR